MPPIGLSPAALLLLPVLPRFSFPVIHPRIPRVRTSQRLRRFQAIASAGMVALAHFEAPAAIARPASAASVPDAVGVADPFAVFIAEASRRFAIPQSWIRAVMQAESRGDTHAVSPKGALGLMQIMPATWSSLRARYRLGADPFDPHDNILAGAAYLREMRDRYGGVGFLAAYNTGPARYEGYLMSGRPLPDETLAYLAKLGPSVAGSPIREAPTVAMTAASWSRAPLFLVRADDFSAAAKPASPVQAGRHSFRADVVDLTDLAPQSSGLFVAISRRNAAP